jgi:hypothetical protein
MDFAGDLEREMQMGGTEKSMTACDKYKTEPDYPGCCAECHRWAFETGQDLEPNPADPQAASVCCRIALWLAQKKLA